MSAQECGGDCDEQKLIEDGGSDSDDYFDRMQDAAAVYGSDAGAQGAAVAAAADVGGACAEEQEAVAEDDYFNSMLEYNSQITDASFLSSDAPVWHSLMRMVARHDHLSVSAASKTRASAAEMLPIDPVNDASRWLLCEQWLFGFLPRSSKLFVQLSNMSRAAAADPREQTVVCVDDYLHPSLAALFKLKNGQLEIVLFTPYAHSEVDWLVFFRTLARLTREYQTATAMYCALEAQIFERVICAQPQWQQLWVEWCDILVLQDTFTAVSSLSSSSCSSVFTCSSEGSGHYAVSDLTAEDAELINSTWKYRTETSLATVLQMIASFPCVGIRFHPNGADPSAEAGAVGRSPQLVCWCLTYSDGALGMLYTMPTHRGRGLARRVVQQLLQKLTSTATPSSSSSSSSGGALRYAPFCFIERSNEASKALFRSLGFAKVDEVVWTAQTLRRTSASV